MKVSVDPYLDRKNDVLKNLLGVKDQKTLEDLEADFTSLQIQRLTKNPIKGNFDFEHLCKIHEHIFKNIYEWAGSPRIINIEKSEKVLGGLSIEYADHERIRQEAEAVLSRMKNTKWDQMSLEQKSIEFSNQMADLWKVHPFREGNTRTTVTFCCDFAESRGFGLDRNLFKDNSEYMRTALVAASAKFSDELGDKSKPEYLYKIVKDGMERFEASREAAKEGTKEMNAMSMSSWRNAVNSPAPGIGQTGRENVADKVIDQTDRDDI